MVFRQTHCKNMNFNLIGAGKLGKNIALALSVNKLANLQSICNQSLDSALNACNHIGSGTATSQIESLKKADVTWITCNDDSISTIVGTLNQSSILQPGSIVVHCSGALSSSILSPLKAQGFSVASFHPLKAFKANYLSANAFDTVDCILEGDEAACSWLKSVFTPLNANIIPIQTEYKAAYHAGACIASNYLITLASTAQHLFQQAGIPQQQAQEMICKLMQGNINNMVESQQIKSSLTGPLMRGDVHTISLHLQSIKQPEIAKLYKSAGLATLEMTELSIDKKNLLIELLNN